VIVVAIGAMIVSNFVDQTYSATSVTGETHNSSGTTPETITATNVDGGISGVSASATDHETSTTYSLTSGTNFSIIDADAGTINMSTINAYINTTADYYTLNYTYDKNTNATTTANAGLSALADFGDWFAIIVVVAVSVIILGLVMLLRNFSGGRV